MPNLGTKLLSLVTNIWPCMPCNVCHSTPCVCGRHIQVSKPLSRALEHKAGKQLRLRSPLRRCRWYLHEEQGPLRKLVQKLLHVGRRNARLATALVLQLSQLFLACPAVALLYEEELLQLMLADSKDACSSAEVSTAVNNFGTSL